MGSGFLHDVSDLRLTAEQVADAIAATGLLPVIGSGQIESSTDGKGGTALGFRPGAMRITDVRLAAVTDRGPQGQADFADARYWTQAGEAVAATMSDRLDVRADNRNYPSDWWAPATNLAEWASDGGTHGLAVNATQLTVVFRLVDAGGEERFVFSVGGGSPIRFAKLKTAWPAFADHNKVTLTRCKSASDATVLLDGTGAPLADITAYIQTPLGSTPPFFAVNVNDVLDYYTDPSGNNILLHVPMPGTNNLYDVQQITSLVGGKGVGGCGPLKAQ